MEGVRQPVVSGSPTARCSAPSSAAASPRYAPIWWWNLELASPSDEDPRALTALRSKMAACKANGARLGWMLIPHKQAVEVWPARGEPQRHESLKVLEAGPQFPGLQLQLDQIWAG